MTIKRFLPWKLESCDSCLCALCRCGSSVVSFEIAAKVKCKREAEISKSEMNSRIKIEKSEDSYSFFVISSSCFSL